MDKVIDHRRYKKGKVYCNKFCDHKEQANCVGYMPFIRDRGCTFKCSGNLCRWNALISEKQTVMIYIVGRLEPKGGRVLLEIDGVFDDYSRAVGHCKTVRHFIGPILLNETLPKEGIAWPGMHYPNRRAIEFTNEKLDVM
ncbi:MAG: hypothetical protein E3J23_01970 [Candidatus Stahlbacteria bacterium]|nr:MAG: hypothetical protein E3J23_01970 [Candidatus Stahlbacteria bacterium]